MDSLDTARYSEDGGVDRGGSGGDVAVLEFELRKARETINALRANLTQFAGKTWNLITISSNNKSIILTLFCAIAQHYLQIDILKKKPSVSLVEGLQKSPLCHFCKKNATLEGMWPLYSCKRPIQLGVVIGIYV